MFDFSSPQNAEGDNAKIQFDENEFDQPLCTFNFYTLDEIISRTASVMETGVFLHTEFTSTLDCAGKTILFHRQAPKVDALECASTKQTATNNLVSSEERLDIVQGAYYGGLKVWSCAPDVAGVVLNGTRQDEGVASDVYGLEIATILKHKKDAAAVVVAELGCGQSLPSLAALHRYFIEKSEHSMLLFLHDYNREVVDEVSLPNVAKSISSWQLSQRKDKVLVGVANGDWCSVASRSFVHPQLNPTGSVDILLAADVTFDLEATEKFLQAAARVLRKPIQSESGRPIAGGMAILGTKEYYFGTGGGLVEMGESIKKFGLPLEMSVIERREAGTLTRVVVTIRRI